MKIALICSAALLGVCLAGCGTLREQQNPQPKTQAPCQEWIDLSKKSAQAPASATTKADTQSVKDKKASAK